MRKNTLQLLLLTIFACGCVQPIQNDSPERRQSQAERSAAVECFDAYRLATAETLVGAAEVAESGATEKTVRDFIASRDAIDHPKALGPMLAPMSYQGEYDGKKTGEALRKIAAELGAK